MLAEADLPDDPEVLRAMIVAASAETARLMAKVEHATAEIERINAEAERNAIAKAEADAGIARLSSIIAAFARHRFGPRSEKLDDDQFELVMEDLSIAIAKVEAKLDAVSTPAKRAEKQRRANRDRDEYRQRTVDVRRVSHLRIECFYPDEHLQT